MGLVLVTVGCGGRVPIPADAGETGGETTVGNLSGVVTTADGSEADDGSESDKGPHINDIHTTPVECSEEEPCALDILVVVDNSADMAASQRALVRGLIPLVQRLETHVPGAEDAVDVQMMFTTTDVGHPLCTQLEKPDYDPAMGAPIVTPCVDRLTRFTGADPGSPEVVEELCTDFCPSSVAPNDRFVAFDHDGSSNVPDAASMDIDGDGTVDSAVARAVACLAPQGIDGCGYESPLTAMLLALDPAAEWNSGARPFLRDGSRVAIILVTTEIDCSHDDPDLMSDPTWWEVNPNGDQPQVSSAACWNAGMSCDEPYADGVRECELRSGPLTSTSVYRERLVDELSVLEGRDVTMVAINGVPEVYGRSADPPYEPTHGGVGGLVIHDVRDGVAPNGDLFPSEVEDGVTAEELTWQWGVGSGCIVAEEAHEARGLPNPRVNEVCAALDGEDEVRCCVESICDPIARLDCIDGWLAR